MLLGWLLAAIIFFAGIVFGWWRMPQVGEPQSRYVLGAFAIVFCSFAVTGFASRVMWGPMNYCAMLQDAMVVLLALIMLGFLGLRRPGSILLFAFGPGSITGFFAGVGCGAILKRTRGQ
jgi:hypothetical protein